MLHSTRRSDRRSYGTFVVAIALAAVVGGFACSGGGGGGGGGTTKPVIALGNTALNFANPYVGGTYTQTFTIGNSGTGALSVTAVTADATATARGITVTTATAPFTVAASATETVTVTYRPTDNTALSGTIQVASSDAATPIAAVTLSSTSTGTPGLAICAMEGKAVSDGCSLDGSGNPQVDLGTVGRGDSVGRVIALSNGGTGNTALEITAVAFDPASPPNYTLSLYNLNGTTEVPVTLPYFLTATDPSGQVAANEVRVRVSYAAPGAAPSGALSGVSVKIDAAFVSTTSTSVPIVGTVSDCTTGKADCDGDPANGCEMIIATNLANCGACGAVCGATHGAPTCTAGVCALNCAAGYANCDGDAATGCETDATTLTDCGTCGNACGSAHAAPTCTAEACVLNCASGYASCDADDANGCETSTATSPTHCGACGNACTAPANATATCTAGACGWTCDTGWANCDGDAANGCEQDIGTDPDHCGACGTVCSGSHMATRTCAAGVCNGTCAAGFGDCNANRQTDGCETDTTSNIANCGSCGNVCGNSNGTASCIGSLCQLTCNAGWGNCDNNKGNGCEVNLLTDPNNCNACGQACSNNGMATRACTSGVCSGACATNYGDCNVTKLDGCETYLPSDSANCGYCGINCSNPVRANVSSAYCSSNACYVNTCSSGYYNQDGTFSDGCECAADAVPDTCGSAQSIGSVAHGSSLTVSHNIVPVTDNDWYEVTFPYSYSGADHPKIVMSDASGVLRFSVYKGTTCSTADSCTAEGGSSTARTTWERYYSYSGDWPDTLVFRVVVYAVASQTSCLPYTLTITN